MSESVCISISLQLYQFQLMFISESDCGYISLSLRLYQFKFAVISVLFCGYISFSLCWYHRVSVLQNNVKSSLYSCVLQK